MTRQLSGDIISHWHHLLEGLQYSPQAFYDGLIRAFAPRQIPDIRVGQIVIKEGGAFSAKRLYLRVTRKWHSFDICGAPFGNAFFVSWWLRDTSTGCLGCLLSIPGLRTVAWLLARPVTYYKLDTAYMFQTAVHAAVLEVIDEIATAKGVRVLSEAERKPIMRDFFQR